jgi:hypothetical protein
MRLRVFLPGRLVSRGLGVGLGAFQRGRRLGATKCDEKSDDAGNHGNDSNPLTYTRMKSYAQKRHVFRVRYAYD